MGDYLNGIFDAFRDFGVLDLLVVVDDVHHLLLQVLAEDIKGDLTRIKVSLRTIENT